MLTKLTTDTVQSTPSTKQLADLPRLFDSRAHRGPTKTHANPNFRHELGLKPKVLTQKPVHHTHYRWKGGVGVAMSWS